MVVKVLINTSVKTLNKVFDYFVPKDLEPKIEIGKRVSVNFGKNTTRIEEGIIVKIEKDIDTNVVSNGTKKYTLKNIEQVLDDVSYVNSERLKFAKWISYMYFCNVYDAIKLMLPPGSASKNASKSLNLKQETSVALKKPANEIINDIELEKISSAKQIRVLRFVIDNGLVLLNDITDGLKISRTVVKTLEKNGYIELKKIDVQTDIFKDLNAKKSSALPPTVEQKNAIGSIKKCLDLKKYNQCLLFGVTGSGKTEVYLQVIEEVLKLNKTVIVLVPEISLTYQTVERFVSRFGNDVAVLHSKMTIAKRKEEYKKIIEGKVHIVVGARSAIFAPISNLGMVIIDEEHDSSYFSQSTPKYSTKEVAEYLCRQNDAILLLGSATPDVVTYYKAKSGEIMLFTMQKRPGNAILPDIKIVDMKNERLLGNTSNISGCLKEEILKNIKNHEQTMIFLNRRGYSSYLVCNNCGHIFKCPNCDVTLTYHKKSNLLLCHYCSHVEKNITKCPICGSENISQGGTGTEKIEEDLKSIYNDISILRMDADTTVARNSHQKILDQFKKENIDVLVGTQMISKGHDIQNVTLVGVLGVDSMLSMNDYASSERAFSNILQVSGRAGRGDKKGRVIIQTSEPQNYILKAVQNNSYIDFYDQEIKSRKMFEYPPFMDILLIELSSINLEVLKKESIKLFDVLNDTKYQKLYKVYSPKSPYIERINNNFRVNIIIKCKFSSNFLKIIYQKFQKYDKIKAKVVNISVTKDPIFIG